MTEKFEKITNVRLPFDLRSSDPKKNYGIHGLDCWFILKGPKGAVQFGFTWHIFLPHIEREERHKWNDFGRGPVSGFDVGYHAHTPQYEGQTTMECSLFEGKPCYYDGSSLRADEWAKEIFSARGHTPEEEIWARLEADYKRRFEDDPTKNERQES